MIDSITTEFYWLILTITMTGLFWIPQIIHSIFKAGPITALLYPDEATKQYAEWAKRSKAAHKNAVENLIIGSDVTDPEGSFKVFYDDLEEKMFFRGYFKLGVQFLYPSLVQWGIFY